MIECEHIKSQREMKMRNKVIKERRRQQNQYIDPSLYGQCLNAEVLWFDMQKRCGRVRLLPGGQSVFLHACVVIDSEVKLPCMTKGRTVSVVVGNGRKPGQSQVNSIQLRF